MHALYGALFAASARTLLGEFEITESTQAKLNDVRKQVEEISELVGDLSPTHPGSWARFVGRYMERTFDTYREFEYSRDWLRAHGYSALRQDLEPFFVEILERVTSKMVFKDNFEAYYECTLEGGVKLCYTHYPEERRRAITIHIRREIDGEEAAIEAMASLFWQGRHAILADAASDITLSDLSLRDHQYHGDLLGIIDEWREFQRHGLRRNVLFQGPPGTGKSTLCFHAARELSKRTLVLTPSFCTDVRIDDWLDAINLLRPDLVIIDDIDRVPTHALETRLPMFEEGYCSIPFVLFTTNDHTKLPEALRRPGRIDQIVVVNEPDQATRYNTIHSLAQRVGTTVPLAELPRLDELFQTSSAAHVLEVLRRAHVQGWEHPTRQGDITFENAWSSEDTDAPKSSNIKSL